MLAFRTVRSSSGATVAVASAATFLALIAFTTPLATLPTTAAALGSGPEGQAWILSSMSIGLGVALLPGGAVADDLGRRRALVLGSAVLVVSSVVCALAPTTAVLVAGRIGAGVGGAALVAAGLGLIGHAFPAGSPEARRASGVWGASLGAGIAVGPLLATGAQELGGWAASYWLEALLAVVLGVVARVVLDESRAERPRPVDGPGVVLLAAGVGVLLTGLVEARGGPTRPLVIVLVLGGLVLLGIWLVVEHRRDAPMIDPELFRSPPFLAATLGALATGAGIIATTSFLLTVMSRGLGAAPVIGAVVLLAWSATGVVTSLLARRLPVSMSGRNPAGGRARRGRGRAADAARGHAGLVAVALRARAARRRDHERGGQLRAGARGRRERAPGARGDGQRGEQHRPLRRVGHRHHRRRGRRDPPRPAVGTRGSAAGVRHGRPRRHRLLAPGRGRGLRVPPASTIPPGGHGGVGAGRLGRMDKAVMERALAETQGPLKQQYRDDPESATVVLKADGDLDGSGIACRVQTAQAMVEAGLHPATGGTGELLCSGDMLLEALVACSGVTLRAVATSMGVEVRGGSIHAEGDLDFRGTLGVAKDAPVGFKDIRLSFDLDTDADDETLATLHKLTERYCVVYQTLVRSPQVSLELSTQGAAAQA